MILMHVRACSAVLSPLSDFTSPAVQARRQERRKYVQLLQQKKTSFWTTSFDIHQQQPSRMWQTFDRLTGCGRVPDLQTRNPDFVTWDPDFQTRDLELQCQDPELESWDPDLQSGIPTFKVGVPTL